jgi:conjugative relaxase-like TrwC/TraI family protein
VAWVTTIGPDAAQVEYRLEGAHGCDAQVDYRLGAPAGMEWIGRGLVDVDLVAGQPIEKAAARRLMDGRHPHTGERLVTPKLAVDPRGKLGARQLVDAIHLQAVEHGVAVDEVLGQDDRLIKRFARVERGLKREGEAHRVPVVDIERLAAAAGLDVADLYEAGHLAEARKHAGARVRVGNRGYDLTLDLPKSYSALFGLAPVELAVQLRETYLQAARETVAAVEDWAVYAMAGHHGDGRRADRVATSGALGWMTVHESARPVNGEVGDPHLHVHVTLANMALSEDGEWRTVGAGGRDIHRHAHAADALVKARLRALTGERFGMRWERAEATGAWEVVGVPVELRRAMSRRDTQVSAAVPADASDAARRVASAKLAERKQDVQAADVRAAWRARAETVVADVDAMVAEAVPGPPPPGTGVDAPTPGPVLPGPEEIAAHIWREDGGLTQHRKVVTRADVLAAVIDACPQGLLNVAAADQLTTDVLAVAGHAVALPADGMRHLSNAQRYTHTSVLDAEETIVSAATSRLAEGAAEITPAAAELAVSAFEASRGFALSGQQREVVERLLTAGHGLDVVVGVAGAGKTTLMAAARAGWEAAGLRVAGASTAAVAASNLQAEGGIPSATVATWLADIAAGGQRMEQTDVLVLDEAGVIDDRALATVLRAAGEHGTKVVAVGDWQQLRAIGVGGGFQRAHQLVHGLALTENRRQRDPAVRHLLDVWRDGARRVTLAGLAEHGHVHAVATADDARTAMLSAWWEQRQAHQGDAHDLLDDLLVLAARNEDVDALNHGARALLQEQGELTGGRSYALAGGGRLEFAPGDLVRVRRNDYGSRRGGVDVLNGFRGTVTEVTAAGVRIQWRRTGPDGPEHHQALISAQSIAAGGLAHGYALTIAAAQGLTAEHAIVYGPGADAQSLYPAITRARQASHLWLPAQVVESETTRARLGEARTDAEQLHRAVTAYAASLTQEPDGMVSDELAEQPDGVVQHPEPPPAVAERRRSAEPVPPGPADPTASPPDPRAREQRRRLEREERHRERLRAERDAAVPSWRARPYGRVPGPELEPRAAHARAEAGRARARQQQLTAEAEALAAVLGTDRAPAAGRYEAYVARLQAAGATLRQAEHTEHQADALTDRVRELWEISARDRATLQRITTRLNTPMSAVTLQRRGLREGAALLHEKLHRDDEEINQARARAEELRAEARQQRQRARVEVDTAAGATHQAPGERLAQLWQELGEVSAREAVRDRHAHQRLTERAAQAGAEATTWDGHVTGLTAEAEARAALSPGRQVQEAAERAAAAQAAAAERAAEARRHREYRPPTPRLDPGGPSLSM